MFSERVSELFDRIGATSADIARHAECSPSNISRLRAGSRVPKSNSPTVEKLISGIYLYCDNLNALPLLCSVFEGNPSAGADMIKAGLCAWLFAESGDTQPSMPSKPSKPYKPAEHRPILFRSFGDKLNDVMTMLDLSNVRLGRAVNLDPSQISRFRGGVRTPKSNMILVNRICDELLLRITEQNRTSELAKLMNVTVADIDDEDEREALFCNWLCDFDSPGNGDSIDRLLDSIDTFNPANKVPLPELNAVATDDIIDKTDDLYWGTNGLREAVIRFLGSVVRNREAELWLYSDQDMNWMVGDPAFQMKWLTLMIGCVKNRTKIRIIHNIDRGSDEMLAAIQSWMPLYMSGMIEPYVCRKKGDMRFSHTIFLCPGRACIFASHLRGAEADGFYEYVTDENRLNAFGSEYDLLILKSEQLVRICVSENSYHLYENSLPNEGGNLSVLLSSLSISTMPSELLTKILDRNSIMGEERERIMSYCDGWRQRLNSSLADGSVREFIPTPTDEALFGGKVHINFGSLLMEKEIFYTPEEYAEHVQAVVSLLNENTDYHFYMLPQSPFDGIQILRQGERVTVIKQNSPYAAFVFSHPYMLRAFDDYFEVLKKKYSTGRNEVRQTLAKFI